MKITTLEESFGEIGVREPWALLGADGTLLDDTVDMHDPALLAMLAAMRKTRRLDEQVVSLQRQGQVGAYGSCRGQEAVQVATATALAETDWLFPTYRDLGALVVRGVPPTALVRIFRGSWHAGHDPHQHRVGLICLPIATHLPHAVGFATAARTAGEDTVVLAYLGDGATSEGDCHEALNFAAVWKAPVVFVIENNQYAISLPVARQSGNPDLARRASGYGMPGMRVDGNDALACLFAARRAVRHARDGLGPVLIEAVTYRLEGHSTADDWTRYRSADEVADWTQLDPIERLTAALTTAGVVDDVALAAIDEDAALAAAELRADVWAESDPHPTEMFEHLFVEPTPRLARQRAILEAELAAEKAAS